MGKGVITGFGGNGSLNSCKKIRGFESPESCENSFDYPYISPLPDELAFLILARVPRSEFWKLRLVNKRYLSLLRSGEVYKIRKEIGVEELLIFILANKESRWWATDRQFKSCRELPVLPSGSSFAAKNKDSFCIGSNLLVFGKEAKRPVTWTYEISTNRWNRGPLLVSPRRLFASASNGNVAYVAGGIGMGTGKKKIMNSAEKFNCESKSWEFLPGMNRQRKLCSGFYMDNKFYVIGGKNEQGVGLTCGEFYNEYRRKWELIPNMLKDSKVLNYPPLVSVANNELYWIEPSSNQLKVYLKRSNSWKALGKVPVRANRRKGLILTFKSLGDELIVIGGVYNDSLAYGMPIHACCPDPNAEVLKWRFLGCDSSQKSDQGQHGNCFASSLNHISLLCRSVEESLEFYQNASQKAGMIR